MLTILFPAGGRGVSWWEGWKICGLLTQVISILYATKLKLFLGLLPMRPAWPFCPRMPKLWWGEVNYAKSPQKKYKKESLQKTKNWHPSLKVNLSKGDRRRGGGRRGESESVCYRCDRLIHKLMKGLYRVSSLTGAPLKALVYTVYPITLEISDFSYRLSLRFFGGHQLKRTSCRP